MTSYNKKKSVFTRSFFIYSMKSVLMKLEAPVRSRLSTIRSLYSLFWNDTKVRIEKERKASCTLKVPTAESLRPVKGNTSGPLWHKLLRFTLQSIFTSISIRGESS